MTCGQPSNIMAIRLPKKSLHGFRLLCSAGVLTPPRTFSPVVLDLRLARLWPFTRHNSPRRLCAPRQIAGLLLHHSYTYCMSRRNFFGGNQLRVVWSKNSCGLARVVFQEPAEPLTTLHRAFTLTSLAGQRKEQNIPLALMIALMMIMLHIRLERMPERALPKQDQPRQALLLHRPHPALRVGVQIWRPRRQWHPRDPGCVDDVLKRRAVFPVPVVDEILAR